MGISGLFVFPPKKIPPPDLPLIKGEEQGGGQFIKTVLEINGVEYKGEIAGVESVYELMEKMQREGKISFTKKNYAGMGQFIETINGIKGGGGKSWIYYVNNKKASVGVSNYKIKEGDVVSWKLEKIFN